MRELRPERDLRIPVERCHWRRPSRRRYGVDVSRGAFFHRFKEEEARRIDLARRAAIEQEERRLVAHERAVREASEALRIYQEEELRIEAVREGARRLEAYRQEQRRRDARTAEYFVRMASIETAIRIAADAGDYNVWMENHNLLRNLRANYMWRS